MSEKMHYAVFATVAGWCGVAGTEAGLRKTVLPRPDRHDVECSILAAYPEAVLAPELFVDLIHRFEAYIAGQIVDFPDTLDLSFATDFQREVWQAARLIPHGQTRSYAWLAGQVQNPQAVRAVGQALGRNPLPVIVPCHRVLSSDGGLGGFSGGLDMKRFLLELEAAATVVSGCSSLVARMRMSPTSCLSGDEKAMRLVPLPDACWSSKTADITLFSLAANWLGSSETHTVSSAG